MEDQTSTKQIMLNYGLMLGFVSILISVANYAVGDIYKPHWAIQVVSLIATIAVIVLGIKKVKELNNGFLSLGDALLSPFLKLVETPPILLLTFLSSMPILSIISSICLDILFLFFCCFFG